MRKIVNIVVGILLICAFYVAGQNIYQTVVVANMSALNILKPQDMDYIWKFNFRQTPLNKNKLRFYKDYYEHLLQVFPSLWDAYGVLGYCYHYLNDDPRAVRSFKMAIDHDPDYFWNYYDLAAIYINESHYKQASGLLQKALSLDPVTSLKRMFTSQWVYMPLLGSDPKSDLAETSTHLKKTYQSTFVLVRVLDQVADNKDVQDDLKKANLELYAF